MSLPSLGPLALLGLAAVCLVVGLRLRGRERAAASPSALPTALRLAAAVPSPPVLRRWPARQRTIERLQAAGVGQAAAPAIERARAGGAQAAGALGIVAAAVAPPAIVLVPALVAGALIAPDRWLAGRARARRRAIVRQLPDLLDLLGICIESGMALDPALQLAVGRLPGALGDEVRATLRELALGTPRRAAYRGLADRAAAPELVQVVAALLQAEELGAPLSGAFAGQAEAVRAARRQGARDRAARAAPKIQLVVALVMVPAALLLVLGVLVIELAHSIGGVVGVS
ncbi:MAG: tight adherence protein [Miltoncostaeaceae bacterium]|nr:tight adherence protein [Miltoncostaeaceae bacterium]